MNKLTFALYFGNRGFFPESLIAGARKELKQTLAKLGHNSLLLEEDATKFGAVETAAEGEKYAKFLEKNRGKFDGVILCLPNFGDETGAIAALHHAGVPILIQAYPDELDKMGPASRRDAFCGKFSIMDVFYQYRLPFTVFPPHTAYPASEDFARQIEWFAGVCRVANGMKRMTVGAIGARTTAFKTVRFDEITLQRYGITTETLDLSDVFRRMREVKTTGGKFKAKAEQLKKITNWKNVPPLSLENLAKLSVVLYDIIKEYQMDALALRCWIELEREMKIAPCILLGDLNEHGIPAACELDVCNAVAMRALSLASGRPATCLDWNNNYGEVPDKCILFHCGPVPMSLMAGKGQIVDHPMIARVLGEGCSFGCNAGRIMPSPMTFASSKTQDGKIVFYTGEGEITNDPIAGDFFGCAGVAQIPNLQQKLLAVGHHGYRHHVSLTFGNVAVPLREAFSQYLKYDMTEI